MRCNTLYYFIVKYLWHCPQFCCLYQILELENNFFINLSEKLPHEYSGVQIMSHDDTCIRNTVCALLSELMIGLNKNSSPVKVLILLCIYTQRNISIYYRTQSAISPIRLYRYSPNSQVTDIPLTGR